MRSLTFLLMFVVCLVAWECTAKTVDEHLAQMAEIAQGEAPLTTATEPVKAGDTDGEKDDNGDNGDKRDSTPKTTTTTAKAAEAEGRDQSTGSKASLTPAEATNAATLKNVISTIAPTEKPIEPETPLQQVSEAQGNMKKDSSICSSSFFALAVLAMFVMMTVGQVS